MKVCRYDKDANPNSCGGCEHGCIERKPATINKEFEQAIKEMEEQYTEKPILFNTEMVKAILAGRKTTTRRIVKGNVQELNIIGSSSSNGINFNYVSFGYGNIKYINSVDIKERVRAPYLPEDILYVRETWCDRWLPDGFLQGKDRYGYKTDGIPSYGYWGNDNQCKDNVWIPSIHMPKEAARIFLKVKEVKVERLQDITEEGALVEGFISTAKLNEDGSDYTGLYARENFQELWNNTLNKKQLQSYGWNANPYVWVIQFEVIQR